MGKSSREFSASTVSLELDSATARPILQPENAMNWVAKVSCSLRTTGGLLLTDRWLNFFFFLAILNAFSMQLRAAEINVYRDSEGRSVYVNSDDRELSALAKHRGADAARRLVEDRRQALIGIDRFIDEAAISQRLDPRLVRAVIQVESAWNVRARSAKGALGLMQLMPMTAQRFGVQDPFDARENIRGGTRYLRFLLDRFRENLRYALAAYNAGEKAVDAWGDVPPYEETRIYLQRIGMIYSAIQQQTELNGSGIMRTVQGSRVIYTNLD